MQGQGWFYDHYGSLVHESEVGAFCGDSRPVQRVAGSPGTRTPITRTRIPLRRIGGASPGWLDDLKAQLKKVPTWAWVTGGAGLVLLLVVTKGEKSDWLKKV